MPPPDQHTAHRLTLLLLVRVEDCAEVISFQHANFNSESLWARLLSFKEHRTYYLQSHSRMLGRALKGLFE